MLSLVTSFRSLLHRKPAQNPQKEPVQNNKNDKRNIVTSKIKTIAVNNNIKNNTVNNNMLARFGNTGYQYGRHEEGYRKGMPQH